MSKQSMDKLRQKANQLVPLLQKKFGEDIRFDIEDEFEVNQETVTIRMVRPDALVVPKVDLKEIPQSLSLQKIADLIEEQFQKTVQETAHMEKGDIPKLTRDFVLRHVVLQAVNREKNAAMLEASPHVDQLDLAGVFLFRMRVNGKREDYDRLRSHEAAFLGLTVDELYDAAKRNTMRRLRPRVIPLEKFAYQIAKKGRWFGESLEDADLEDFGLYVVGNREYQMGASYLLIPEVLQALEEKMGGGFYIAAPDAEEILIQRASEDTMVLEMYLEWLAKQPKSDVRLVEHLYRYDSRHGLQIVDEL